METCRFVFVAETEISFNGSVASCHSIEVLLEQGDAPLLETQKAYIFGGDR